MKKTLDTLDGMVEKILKGDFRAIARMLTMVENGSNEAVPHLRELFAHTGHAFSIGVTGSPGAGKSTFVDRLTDWYRSQQKRVGIIAVDPTSPFSGGAILGDRIRMQSRSVDPGTFIRSMATRGHVGGLTRATSDVLLVMDAAGFDIIIIETVGVGQGEVEIAKMADATVLLLVPGMGDDIQAMKAGIMEIADIYVINKADHPGADRTETEVTALLSMSSRSDGWKPPVIRTIASEGTGIEACAGAVAEYGSFLSTSDTQRAVVIEAQKERLLELACLQARDALLQDTAKAARVEELATLIADRKLDPFSAAEQVLQLHKKK
jgi:LAO/AO transport system kinase